MSLYYRIFTRKFTHTIDFKQFDLKAMLVTFSMHIAN
jgi:hypothetical protein